MTLEVEYRWQFTYYEQMERLPMGEVFPLIVVDGEMLEDSFQIDAFLERQNVTFERFLELVPDGYKGDINILNGNCVPQGN